MANYGKILTPIGLAVLIGGIVVSATAPSGGGPVGVPLLIVGALLFFIGLARLVQGKERKILGQVIRPKAAARASTVYALGVYLATTFYLPGSYILNYVPPFPLAIWFSGYWRIPTLGYMWIPGVTIGMFVLFILGLILSGKIPKTIHVIFNLIMLVCFYFYAVFGLQIFLWSFFEDKSTVAFFNDVGFPFNSFAGQISVGLSLLLFGIYLVLRTIKKTGEAFEAFYAPGSKRVIVFVLVIASYVGTAFPIYYMYLLSTENNAYNTPFINYIGFVFIIYIVIKLFSTILQTIREFARESQAEGITFETAKFGFSSALYLVIFFLAWAPIFLPIIDRGLNTKNNSVYNTDWNGWSNFRQALEDEGYTIYTIQSSISVINSLDSSKQIILVIQGPNVFYNPASEIPFFLTAFQRNFSMFICADQGTAESLLFETFVASMGRTPITFIPDGILRDNSSYWKTPAFPIITNFVSSPITQGIHKVVLSYASGFLGGDIMAGLGWDLVGMTSGDYSFIDVDNNGEYDQSVDVYKVPRSVTNILKEQEGMAGLFGQLLEIGFPLGGYSQAVFATKEISSTSRLFCATDATWLDNELTSIPDYDNLQLGLNAMAWLRCGRSIEDTIIVFDEAHLRVESGWMDISSAGSFGLVQGYVNWLSTNPILGLFYPLFALNTLKKWIPKEGDKQKIQLKDLEEAERNQAMLRFRTSSFFAQKINWYKQTKKYGLALKQLYRRLERKTNRMLGASAERDAEAIVRAIRRERGRSISEDAYKRMEQFFKKMIAIKNGVEDVDNEEKFEEMFMEMKWVNDILSQR